MVNSKQVRQQMKMHSAIITLKADLQIARFLKIAQSFVIKVGKELEATDGNSTAVAKR